LTKRYRPGTPALNDLSFRLEGSGAIGFLGPNGAGKTTTLKLLVGLLNPSGGRAFLNGYDPMKDRRRALADVGAVIENPEPYPSETIFDALERVGQLRGLEEAEIDDEVDRCNALLHLPPLERTCGGLSKGERQRVVLAAACIGDPGVLLLDEPTNGMDPVERAQARQMLARLKSDHLILMSSHLINDVAEVCDRVIIIDHGAILFQDTVDGFAQPALRKAVDIEFVNPVPVESLGLLTNRLRGIKRLGSRKFRFYFDGADSSTAGLIEECLRIGPISGCSAAAPPLEETYREIISGTLPAST
jgi:ABC-2 type transport system ATP-binding protein